MSKTRLTVNFILSKRAVLFIFFNKHFKMLLMLDQVTFILTFPLPLVDNFKDN